MPDKQQLLIECERGGKKTASKLQTLNINDEFNVAVPQYNTIQCVRADNGKISYKIDAIFSN